jgi:hypothetical protein
MLYLALVALKMEVFVKCPKPRSGGLSRLRHNLFFAAVAGWRKFSKMVNTFLTSTKYVRILCRIISYVYVHRSLCTEQMSPYSDSNLMGQCHEIVVEVRPWELE